MYNFKISTFLLLAALLIGCAIANVEVERAASSTVSVHIFESSSVWWLAVQPRNDNSQTVKVELRDGSAPSDGAYTPMVANAGWGYYTFTSTSGRGFTFPVSLKLTSSSGATIVLALTGNTPGALVDSGKVYGSSSSSTPAPASTPKPSTTPAPSTPRPSNTPAPSTQAPSTPKPTTAPSSAPTTRPSSAPTTRPGSAATSAPTTKPTSAPSTPAPTTKPTSAPSTPRPSTTPAPTTRPTTPATGGDLCAVVPTSSEPMQLLVPLYVYPGAAWDALVAVASKVKIIAIINPNSGPLTTVDATYSQYMTKLANAGVTMVGYVHTLYGARDLALVKSEIDTYASKYPLVKGIFLDEAANDAANVAYYTQVYNHIMSKSGYAHAILNPGVQPDQGYLPISTNIVIFENYASSLASSSYSNWVKCAPNAAQKAGYKYKFSAIIHTATLANTASYINTIHNQGMGLVYVTDGAGGCCTYNTLATYFAQEATSVATLNA